MSQNSTCRGSSVSERKKRGRESFRMNEVAEQGAPPHRRPRAVLHKLNGLGGAARGALER